MALEIHAPRVQVEDESPTSFGGSLSSTDLVDLMSKFNEVTSKLEQTHGQLRSEVSRLNSELHQANEALERSRRLAALGEMAAGISHEIRNPLGSIRLYANMLVEDLSEMPEQQQVVTKIGRAVSGLDEIVGDVLTFAREMKVHWQSSDPRAIIEHACEMALDGFESTVECDFSELESSGKFDSLICDPLLMHQALVNVLRNAGEANRVNGGSRVVVRCASSMMIENDQEVRSIVFSVRDEGDGIPDHVIERMFNPFFTTRVTGTGLGLAIVHRIIDAHHGFIQVQKNTQSGVDTSDSCDGTTIEFHIPLSPAVVVTKSIDEIGAHGFGVTKEDQPFSRENLARGIS